MPAPLQAVAYPAYLREKARELRIAKKLTIDELAERLSVPRTTIYYWVRDLPIPGSGSGGGWPESARRKGSQAVKRKYRLLREAAYERGRLEFDELACDPTFRDFVCLYLAEGSKRSRNAVAICNSDPAIVTLGNRWIRRLATNPVGYAIQYHADQDLMELRSFWSARLAIDAAAIRFQRKSNSNTLTGRTWRSRYGVLTISVGDTYLRARLQAWMDCLRDSWT